MWSVQTAKRPNRRTENELAPGFYKRRQKKLDLGFGDSLSLQMIATRKAPDRSGATSKTDTRRARW